MLRDANPFLLTAAVFNALVALLHIGCVVFGASWYRFFGAGEQMARMAETGRWYPTAVTLGLAAMCAGWSLYALSGAGVILRFPFVRAVLVLITAAYLLRGVGWVALMPVFPENGRAFWFWSSAISFSIGAVHVVGLRQVWSRL